MDLKTIAAAAAQLAGGAQYAPDVRATDASIAELVGNLADNMAALAETMEKQGDTLAAHADTIAKQGDTLAELQADLRKLSTKKTAA